MLGLGLSTLVRRRLVVVPVAVSVSLLNHGLQGFYPLLPLMRKLGVRTQREIDRERYALLSLL